MRTTLTIDDDVAALLRRAIKRTNKSLKEVINDVLRTGLESATVVPKPPSYRLVPHDGGRVMFPLDSVSEALGYAEGEDHR